MMRAQGLCKTLPGSKTLLGRKGLGKGKGATSGKAGGKGKGPTGGKSGKGAKKTVSSITSSSSRSRTVCKPALHGMSVADGTWTLVGGESQKQC